MEWIVEAESLSDFVVHGRYTVHTKPLIRCRECKHSENLYGDKRRCFLWHEIGIDVFEDGYCSYAERCEDGSD